MTRIKIQQEGITPLATRSLGFLLFVVVIFLGSQDVLELFWRIKHQSYPNLQLVDVLLVVVISVLFVGFSIVVLEVIGGLFPTMSIVNGRIVYRRLFITRCLDWKDIEFIAKVKKPFGSYALAYSRQPLNMFDLWVGSLHGRLAGLSRPVLFLSISTDQRDHLACLIHKHHEI